MRIAVKQSGNGTTRKWKQYIGNAAEMTRFEKIPRVHFTHWEVFLYEQKGKTKKKTEMLLTHFWCKISLIIKM